MLKTKANISFKEVFPELPVIDIIFEFETFLNVEAAFVKVFKELSTLIFLILLFLYEFTMQKAAPFLIASSANLLPSLDLPFKPKNISFLLIFLELIKIFLEFNFLLILFKSQCSFKIFNFQSLNRDVFFKLIKCNIFCSYI